MIDKEVYTLVTPDILERFKARILSLVLQDPSMRIDALIVLDYIDYLKMIIEEGIEAVRLTREYVGEEVLPEIEGWSWFDWTLKAQGVINAKKDVPNSI